MNIVHTRVRSPYRSNPSPIPEEEVPPKIEEWLAPSKNNESQQ